MKSVLLEHFPDLTDVQISQYQRFSELFTSWNEKINCISRKDINNLFVNHILHSLSIAKIFNFTDNTMIADIGTGGGFPGIPLAIMFPEVKFDLIDSIGKKINVVKNISEELCLKNITPINTRAETLKCKYDFVVSRAVTSFPKFYQMTKHLILIKQKNSGQGIIYLKGGDFENEISGFKHISIYYINEYLNYDYFKTNSVLNKLLIASKIRKY